MSYNGSGTFNINTAGQPVVTGTVISSTAFNALTADLATGLSTAITKDGQTAATARIPFAQGISSTLVTDSTSTTTGSIITAGGVGVAKALFVGTTANVAGAVTLQSTLAVGGVATYSAQPIFSSLTASSAVATDASKGLVSVTNTGTGNNVLATSPTITTPTISGDASISGLTVGKGANAVARNTAFGITALAAATGNFNTGIGNLALLTNSTGTSNTAVGDSALRLNTTGGSNTAIGQGAIELNTTGSDNAAIGKDAFSSNTTGSSNTALGKGALAANTTASNNTAVGYHALVANTTALNNVAVGFQALTAVTTGGDNTAIGKTSGSLITTGSKNTILGQYSGNQGGLDIRTSNSNIVLSDGDGNPRLKMDSTGQLSSLIVGVGLFEDYGCRAWVNFNGTGTVAIRGSGNVSSITDNGTGDYTVNFTTAMPDVNYSFLAGAQANGVANGPMVDLYGVGATGSARFRVFTQASAAMDSPVCTFAAFR